jgi:hypothetical protein
MSTVIHKTTKLKTTPNASQRISKLLHSVGQHFVGVIGASDGKCSFCYQFLDKNTDESWNVLLTEALINGTKELSGNIKQGKHHYDTLMFTSEEELSKRGLI